MAEGDGMSKLNRIVRHHRLDRVRNFGDRCLLLRFRGQPPAYTATVHVQSIDVIDASVDKVTDVTAPRVVRTHKTSTFNRVTFDRFAERTESEFDAGTFDHLRNEPTS